MKLTAFSTARVSTWMMLEEYGLLFDAGDGVCAALGNKAGKIRHVFVTHADRDHVSGLIRLNEFTEKPNGLTIYYPRDCGSFPALQSFCARFDPHVRPAQWVGLSDGDDVPISNELTVKARVNDHIEAVPGQIKSLDFTLIAQRRKLRPQLSGMAGHEIAALRQSQGENAVTVLEERPLLGYSGDTTSLQTERWEGIETLIHESTFLESSAARGRHASLPQVIEALAAIQPKRVVLYHFSSRYSNLEIQNAVSTLMKQHNITSELFLVLPGEVVDHVFASQPMRPIA